MKYFRKDFSIQTRPQTNLIWAKAPCPSPATVRDPSHRPAPARNSMNQCRDKVEARMRSQGSIIIIRFYKIYFYSSWLIFWSSLPNWTDTVWKNEVGQWASSKVAKLMLQGIVFPFSDSTRSRALDYLASGISLNSLQWQPSPSKYEWFYQHDTRAFSRIDPPFLSQRMQIILNRVTLWEFRYSENGENQLFCWFYCHRRGPNMKTWMSGSHSFFVFFHCHLRQVFCCFIFQSQEVLRNWKSERSCFVVISSSASSPWVTMLNKVLIGPLLLLISRPPNIS